jgi:hypothetical protein
MIFQFIVAVSFIVGGNPEKITNLWVWIPLMMGCSGLEQAQQCGISKQIVQVLIYICVLYLSDGVMVSMLTSVQYIVGFIPGWVNSKTIKLVFAASQLITHLSCMSSQCLWIVHSWLHLWFSQSFIVLDQHQGWIQDFKLGGAHLKKLCRAEGGVKMLGVFRVKNHDICSFSTNYTSLRCKSKYIVYE